MICGKDSSHFAVKERRVRGNEMERGIDIERNGEQYGKDDQHEVHERDSN